MHRIEGWSLQRRLLGGLSCILALIAAGLYFLLAGYAARAADRAFDQLLLASALSVADSVQVDEAGAIAVDLPYASLAILATGRRDRIFYRIAAPDGGLVTGYADLAAACRPRRRHGPRFADATYLGAPVRAVVLGRLVADAGGPLDHRSWWRTRATSAERWRPGSSPTPSCRCCWWSWWPAA